jgi:diguanylate cyclase (GGDEF)-like protein
METAAGISNKAIMIIKDDTKVIITLGFCAILVLMSLLVFIALRQLQDLNHSMSTVVEEMNAKMEAANSMRDAILLRAISLKTMALSNDLFERDDEYMRFVDYSRSYREARERLLAKQMDAREKEIHSQLTEATRAAQPLNDHMADLLLTNTAASEAAAAVAVREAVKHQEILMNLLEELVNYERVSTEMALKSANTQYNESRHVMFILAGIALVFGLFIAVLVIRRSAEKNLHIHHQANHDALTGLLNRRAFEREFELLVSMSANTQLNNALLYLDLDQFKIVNDTCGHMAGDDLLCQLTVVFTSRLRKTDIIARLGGDEFGVLLKNCSITDATRVAETLRESAENFHFSWQGKQFSLGVSIGVVPIKHDSGSMATLLSTADMACLEAKHSGRNRVRVADIDDHQIMQRRSEMDCVGRIKLALEEDRLSLYCQPVVPVGRSLKQPDHVEILVRMISIEGELVQPGSFIPAAERYGLMCSIDKWVVKHASQWLQQWHEVTAPPKLMINLSGQSVCDESFLQYIVETLDSGDIQPGGFCFEITETSAIANLDKAVSFINTLKAMGCEFALDDFGSGLSSFTYLKRLPVDYLKIDGTFVREIVNEPIDRAMVKSINEIGHVMGMKTIAEFVEDDAILHMLQEIGVDYAQGYGIAIPQPLDEFVTRSLPVKDSTVTLIHRGAV